jgi:hypothetical protein
MADEAPKPYDIQSQPAILSPPLGTGKKRRFSAANEELRDIPADPPAYDAPERPAPSPAAASRGASADAASEEERRLGLQLARSLEAGGYHPVVLFGTAFSGKTSLLLSLFSGLVSEPRLETGLALCDPILGSADGIGRRLHEDARRLFDVGTQAFIAGEPTPKTNAELPFFIPVEVRPAGRPAQRFAFLESNGEWYRPLKERGGRYSDLDRTAPELKATIESFIANYQGGISFIYLTPYTQRFAYDGQDENEDSHGIESASLAIKSVLDAYDRSRVTHRLSDRHLMLVTKWDARSAGQGDQVDRVLEDRVALEDFCHARYGMALAAFQGLNVDPDQRHLNAYVSGIINKHGQLQIKNDDDLKSVVKSYPPRLWNYLYKNALQAEGEAPAPLFPEPPKPPALVRLFHKLLDFISGR